MKTLLVLVIIALFLIPACGPAQAAPASNVSLEERMTKLEGRVSALERVTGTGKYPTNIFTPSLSELNSRVSALERKENPMFPTRQNPWDPHP